MIYDLCYIETNKGIKIHCYQKYVCLKIRRSQELYRVEQGPGQDFFPFFLVELVLDWVKYNGVMLTFLGQDTLKSVR